MAIVRPEDAVPVRAWITQRQTGEPRVDGEANAWVSRQVWIRYLDPHGREGRAWL